MVMTVPNEIGRADPEHFSAPFDVGLMVLMQLAIENMSPRVCVAETGGKDNHKDLNLLFQTYTTVSSSQSSVG